MKITKKNVIDEWAKGYPCVTLWLSKIQKKESSAFRLWQYCETVHKNPDELLALKLKSESRDAELLLDQFVASSPFTNAITYNIAIAVKSLHKHNYRDLAKASGIVSLVKVRPYRKHSKEELLKIYRACQNPMHRALITFTFSTSIAKESLTKLKWKHLEPNWESQELPHISLPSEIIKGHGLGKYRGTRQETFLTPEAKKDLIEYRQWMANQGVQFMPEDPIFVSAKGLKRKGALTAEGLTMVAHVLSKRSGVSFSWHDARRYVETALEETKFDANWLRKIRGRKVRGEEAPYSRPSIEQLRNAYREAVSLLEFTQPTSLMELKERQKVVERLNAKQIAGEPYNDEDRTNMKRYGITIPIWRKTAIKTEHNGGEMDCEFQQISEANLLQYLKAGWSIVKELQSGEVIVKH